MSPQELETFLLDSEDPFVRVLGMLCSLKLERGAGYNSGGIELESYFPFGRISYLQMIHIKATRLRSLTGIAADSDKFLDTLLDISNYAIFAIMREKQWK